MSSHRLTVAAAAALIVAPFGCSSSYQTGAAGSGGDTCSWTANPTCPPPPQAPTGPCVPGSDATGADGGLNTACNTCLTSTCGTSWDCCGSDPTQVSQGSNTYASCLILAQCVVTDLVSGQSYAGALPACENAGTYSQASEVAAEELVQCYMAQCTSVCP